MQSNKIVDAIDNQTKQSDIDAPSIPEEWHAITPDVQNAYDNLHKSTGPTASIPLSVDFADKNQYVENTHTPIVQDNLSPIPTRLETIKGSLLDTLEISIAGSYLSDRTSSNPFHDVVPEGWNPTQDQSNYSGIRPENQGYIARATSPNDAINRHSIALDRQNENDNWENGTSFNKIIGGFLSLPVNPSSYIPIVSALKYGRLAEGVIFNMMRVAPGLAAQAVTHDAITNSLQETGSLEKFVYESFRDVAIGTTLAGIGIGSSLAVDALKVYNTRKLLDLSWEGMDIRKVISADAKSEHYEVIPLANSGNAGAAKLEAAQQFVNSQFEKSGLFQLPYAGAAIDWFSKKTSPIYRGLNSKYPVIQQLTNAVASHSLLTKGIMAGEAAPVRFQEMMWNVDGKNRDLFAQWEGHYNEWIGIDPNAGPMSGLAQQTVKKWSKGEGYGTKEEFSDAVSYVIDTGTPSEHPAVNNAAKMISDSYHETYTENLLTNHNTDEYLDPLTSFKYQSRVYSQDALLTGESKWVDMVVNYTNESQKIIDGYHVPINDFSERLKADKRNHEILIKSGAKKDIVEASAIKIARNSKILRGMKNKLQNDLRTDKKLRHLVDNPSGLSADEAAQIRKIEKPQTIIKKSLAEIKSSISDTQQKLHYAEQKITSSKSKTSGQEKIKERDKLKKSLELLKDQQDKLLGKMGEEADKVRNAIDEGKIPRFLTKRESDESNFFILKDNKDRLKFTKLPQTKEEIAGEASATRTTLMGQTNEQTIAQIMQKLHGTNNTNALKNRSLMIPDDVLRQNGFLTKDIMLNLANYNRALGRDTALKTSLKNLSPDGSMEGLIARLNEENKAMTGPKYDNYGQLIPNKMSEKEKLNKLRKEDKEYKEGIEFIKNTYDRMMARNNLTLTQRKVMNIAQLGVAATKLGFVALTMSTDMAAIAFKHGLWPSIRDGLLPMIKTMDGHLSSPESKIYRADAAHAHIANNDLIITQMNQNAIGITENQMPSLGRVSSTLEKVAQASGNINLTNYIENSLQRWTASVSQSKIMKAMYDYANGTLSKADERDLLIYGLKPSEWSERFIAAHKASKGGGNGFGGYESRYSQWGDVEASNKFANTVMLSVKDTIVRRGMMDAPFFTSSSLLGMLYGSLKGWMYATNTRYMLPLMQQPLKGNHLTGAIAMLGAGATQDPLKRLARGAPQSEDDDENMWFGALSNSGIMSLPTSMLQELNLVFHPDFLKGMLNENHRNRSISGIIAGPIGGMTEDIIRLMRMAGSGNYNKADLERAGRMLPIVSGVWGRGAVNKFIESLDIPQTFGEAGSSK